MHFHSPQGTSFRFGSIVRALALSTLLASGLFLGCKSSAPVARQAAPAEPVILKIGDKAFTTDEFFQSFTKNQMATDSGQRTDIQEYFNLYTNLKLKVLAAQEEGRDTTEAFREEIQTYRKQLAQSYMNDKLLIENLVGEAYERLKTEVHASHLLIAVPEDASPADTLAAYETIQGLRKRAEAGEDFAALAKQYSKDPTVTKNNGDLGYFTAFQFIYPIETAAYTTANGGVSAPVRSRSGYHLVKVHDRRPSRGKVRVAHILVRMSPGAGNDGQEAARKRIEEVYARLQKGDSFDNLAREYSDDRESRNTGGVLPVFGTGSMVSAFEEAAFALNQPGQYSRPFQSQYGWHIVRLLERVPQESLETLAPMLRQKVVSDTRGELVRQTLVDRLRKLYTVQEVPDVLRQVLTLADSSLAQGVWKQPKTLSPALDRKAIVQVNGQAYTVNEFLETVARRQQPKPAGSSPTVVMQRLFRRFIDDKLIEQEEKQLEQKYPDFRALMNDIRDGVLLSQVMEANVWEKSLADSVGQRALYEQNKEKYRYEQRAFATILDAADEETLRQATEMLAKAPYPLRRSTADLVYAPNQSALTPRQREALFDLMVIMIKNPEYLVEVAGSADASERDTVSAARIRTVVSYLTSNGVPLTRITEKDYSRYRAGARGEQARRVTFQLFSNAPEDVAKVLNGKRPNALTLSRGLFTRGQSALVDAVAWEPNLATPVSRVLPQNGRVVRVTIERLEAPRVKTFEEARGAVINDYQAALEKQLLDRLRQRYPVQVNEAEVRKLVK